MVLFAVWGWGGGGGFRDVVIGIKFERGQIVLSVRGAANSRGRSLWLDGPKREDGNRTGTLWNLGVGEGRTGASRLFDVAGAAGVCV